MPASVLASPLRRTIDQNTDLVPVETVVGIRIDHSQEICQPRLLRGGRRRESVKREAEVTGVRHEY